jgi:hypothetical protein
MTGTLGRLKVFRLGMMIGQDTGISRNKIGYGRIK